MINDNLHKLIFNKNNNELTPALFLDRDGVILKEKDHLSDPCRVELEKGIKNLMEYFTEKKNTYNCSYQSIRNCKSKI